MVAEEGKGYSSSSSFINKEGYVMFGQTSEIQ